MKTINAIYLVDKDDTADLKQRIIEEHRSETVILQETIRLRNSIDDFDEFASFNLSQSSTKTVNDEEIVTNGITNIFRKLLEDNDERELVNVQMGYIGLTVPYEASVEDDVEFNYFPSVESLCRYMKTQKMASVRSDWHEKNSMVFLQSSIRYEMTKSNAIEFLDGNDFQYLRKSERMNSRFFVIRAEPMKIVIDSMNENCGRGKSLQRLYYLFESIKNWSRNLMNTSWIQIEVAPNKEDFTYTRKIFARDEKRGTGIRSDFITKDFTFDVTYCFSKFYLAQAEKDEMSKCLVLIDFLSQIGINTSLKNFSGTIRRSTVDLYDYHQDQIISERLAKKSENRALRYLQKQNPDIAQKVSKENQLVMPKPKSRQN